MKLIKLRTTESTNSFLKEMAKKTFIDDFTVLITEEQTSGRGQVDQKWVSEPFKNLTFSVFVVFESLSVKHKKYLNFAVSLSVFDVLNELELPKLSIKWPNDILSERRKLCGILIENQLKKDRIASSIIGIGLNVNQTNFEGLPNATSIKNILNKTLDLEILLEKIVVKLKEKIELLTESKFVELEKEYLLKLYRYNSPSMYKNKKGELFMGKIIGVSLEGKLKLELEDESVQEFGIKELKFI